MGWKKSFKCQGLVMYLFHGHAQYDSPCEPKLATQWNIPELSSETIT